MERVVNCYRMGDEEKKANRAYYRSLTPEQRTTILIEMIEDYYGTEHRLERVPESVHIRRR
ncbi:MAG: hypothetical protein P4L46_24570 [Fimbriimonas sp.]|nr:hypothetical protein [Fimbriimonas sp.]